MLRPTLAILAALTSAALMPAQSFVVPAGTLPSNGWCNSFPFNTSDMRYQTLVHASDLGSTAGWISGLAFAPCSTGVRSMTSITVKMAHFSGGTLSTTFDANLNMPGPALTVLDTTDHAWHMTADTWNEIGLQNRFPYNGVDALVIEVLVTGSSGASGAIYRESTHERVYETNYVGQTVGRKTTSAFKMKLFLGDTGLQTLGTGCAGSHGTPEFGFSGSAQLGATLNFECRNAPPSGVVLFSLGTNSRLPVFPVDLTPVGAPGCKLYHDAAATVGTAADPSGFATIGLGVPTVPALAGSVLYASSILMDQNANALGWTSSNYGRAMLGS